MWNIAFKQLLIWGCSFISNFFYHFKAIMDIPVYKSFHMSLLILKFYLVLTSFASFLNNIYFLVTVDIKYYISFRGPIQWLHIYACRVIIRSKLLPVWHHTSLLQGYWLYSLCSTLRLRDCFVTTSLYFLIPSPLFFADSFFTKFIF